MNNNRTYQSQFKATEGEYEKRVFCFRCVKYHVNIAFPLHLETLKENWLQESSVMAGRDAVKRLVDFGQISDVRVFLFHSNVVFIQISKHIYKATLQEGKGMQRVSTILSEAVGIGEILCLAKECFISSVH